MYAETNFTIAGAAQGTSNSNQQLFLFSHDMMMMDTIQPDTEEQQSSSLSSLTQDCLFVTRNS